MSTGFTEQKGQLKVLKVCRLNFGMHTHLYGSSWTSDLWRTRSAFLEKLLGQRMRLLSSVQYVHRCLPKSGPTDSSEAWKLKKQGNQSQEPTFSTHPRPSAGSFCIYYLAYLSFVSNPLHGSPVPSYSPPLFSCSPLLCMFDLYIQEESNGEQGQR